jgi:hypothetical protein
MSERLIAKDPNNKDPVKENKFREHLAGFAVEIFFS